MMIFELSHLSCEIIKTDKNTPTNLQKTPNSYLVDEIQLHLNFPKENILTVSLGSKALVPEMSIHKNIHLLKASSAVYIFIQAFHGSPNLIKKEEHAFFSYVSSVTHNM